MIANVIVKVMFANNPIINTTIIIVPEQPSLIYATPFSLEN